LSIKVTEVRWHGRGGQGIVTASQLLARAALREGKYIQSFPEFGPERMGAPIKSYTRISDTAIKIHSGVESPDIVVVLDPTLIGHINIGEGLAENGLIILNSNLSIEQAAKESGLSENKILTIDASKIAIESIGKNLVNTCIMGALIKATGIVSLETLIKEIEISFTGKFNRKLIDGNITAAKRAYSELKLNAKKGLA